MSNYNLRRGNQVINRVFQLFSNGFNGFRDNFLRTEQLANEDKQRQEGHTYAYLMNYTYNINVIRTGRHMHTIFKLCSMKYQEVQVYTMEHEYSMLLNMQNLKYQILKNLIM